MIAELVCADVVSATAADGVLSKIAALDSANVECLASVSAGVVRVRKPPLFFIAKDMDFNLTTKAIDFNFVAKTENVKFG